MTKLSPFHQELFSLMQGQIGEALPDSMMLDEIVAKFQKSVAHQDDGRIELEWMRALSEDEFAKLGLKKYFPRIYRGLPRVYNRDDPSQSRLKKHFTDLGALKNLSVDAAIFSLYDRFVVEAGTKVGILTWVMSDGLGDWMAAQEAGRVLRARFPGLDVHLFAITQRASLPETDFPTHVIRYEGEAKDQLIDIAFGMDFVLQIPTYFPNSRGLFSNVSMECIGEYGFLESSWYHPQSQCRSMGLHALEQGIFIRRHKEVTFAEIEQKALLKALFGTEMPGPAEMAQYKLRARFHLAYLATSIGGAIYLHSLLKMWKRDEKDIDICSPELGWILQWMERREAEGVPFLEESYGVKELRLEWDGKVHLVPVNQTGKVVRIICPGIVTHADMQRLVSLSGDWVGVRGNQSLSEAISAGKAFFYDGRDHSRYLMKDMVAMAENRLSQYRSALYVFRLMGEAFLWNLPEYLEQWVDDTHFQQEGKKGWFDLATQIGLCLQDPDAIAGFRKFGLICSEEKSFGSFLCHLVQRSLMHLENPELSLDEERLRKLFGAGDISFTTFVNHLMKKIQSFV